MSTAGDKEYASAWLLKYSGNSKPGRFIIPSLYQFAFGSFRLFNDYSPGGGISRTSVGLTLDPCGSGAGLPGEKNSNDNHTGPSIFGDQYHISEVRVDLAGQKGWKALNNNREIPWVWSVIEFDPNGYPDYGRIRNSDPTATTPTTNYQIFPTYYIYVNGILTYTTKQGTPGAFASVPPGSQLSPGDIQ